jgi:hypothetical protein
MLGSNPSADSVASTDRKRGCFGIPFHLRWETPIGRGIKALNPGGAGAKPLLATACFLRNSFVVFPLHHLRGIPSANH